MDFPQLFATVNLENDYRVRIEFLILRFNLTIMMRMFENL
jgi:hypothetical protein